MELNEINLWAFYYNPMTWESQAVIESYHKTEAGAIRAMEKHKNNEQQIFNDLYKDEEPPFEFGNFEDWFVRPFKLKIEE